MIIAFFVQGEPKGQPRPRSFSRGVKARVYDPGTAEYWKSCIAMAANPCLPDSPLSGAIALEIEIYFKRPARLRTKKALARTGIPHTSKPDSDNAAKAIMDALTTIRMWSDDALVYSLQVVKRYTDDGRTGAHIRIKEVEIG